MNEIVQITEDVMSVETGTVAMLAAAEIDQQISTAKKYPRSLQSFRQEAMSMVTLNELVAQECIYSLPRDGKTIEGPSARFAEIIVSAWGNCRSGARIVNEGNEFVTAQGVCHDLQRNVSITFEIQRRITNRQGRRFSADMIAVTGNAASSIALRNAILKVVPKAFWSDIYQAARQTVMGDFSTLANRRDNAIKAFVAYGVSKEQIFEVLGLKGVEDIGLEHLVTLGGILTAIKEGDTTPEQAFGSHKQSKASPPPPPPPEQAKQKAPAPQPEPTSQPDLPATHAAPGAADKAAPPPPPNPGAAKQQSEQRFTIDSAGAVWDKVKDRKVPPHFVTTAGENGFAIGDGYYRWLEEAEKHQAQQKAAPPPPPPAPPAAAEDIPMEPDAFIEEMQARMKDAGHEDDVIAVWHEMSPEDILDFPGDLSRAQDIYDAERARAGGGR